MDYSYTRKQFLLAVDTLATSPASIQERVVEAFNNYLHRLTPKDLPKTLRENFEWVYQEAVKYRDATQTLSQAEGVELAKQITYMWATILDEMMEED
jgi:hypothetical protein